MESRSKAVERERQVPLARRRQWAAAVVVVEIQPQRVVALAVGRFGAAVAAAAAAESILAMWPVRAEPAA